MIETKYPMTQAIRVLKDHGVPFTIHSYKYEEHGGTEAAARELQVGEHGVIKTLVGSRKDIVNSFLMLPTVRTS
jgi:prolyl-tRNA editing enzyme YbaK/EbsC (Cys-tRNA(Pro) deacylase)